ncbi:MAG TPA: hypothetical protein VNQ76_19365 [Planctomicrobium sp.]|nr:hypothetical protein [Planctomicrobium sp.]
MMNSQSRRSIRREHVITLLMKFVLIIVFINGRGPACVEGAEPAFRAAPVYRPDDRRPLRDDARAASLGIQKYTSRHLILYTDIDPQIARTLPPLINQIMPAWEAYFGELPPARDGSDFQMTCYLMQDQERFAAAGMQPEGVMLTRFGRQIGREFWMLEQSGDYYRRHLFFHEATHAFMTTLPSVLPPLWYLEGMAEYFATHSIDDRGRITFGIMPIAPEQVPEWGRIELIRQENFYRRTLSLPQIGAMTNDQFIQPRPVPYSWSWAVCSFLDRHPRYQDRFRQLGQNMEYSAFQRLMEELFEPDRRLLAAEWGEFARRLDYGFDIPANAFLSRPSRSWSNGETVTIEVASRQGWQSTGLHVDGGKSVSIQATGQVQLKPGTVPWVSEPQGISLDYAGGFPVGTLLAAWLPLASAVDEETEIQLEVTPVGSGATITASKSSELWLRINDHGDDLHNNEGSYHVEITGVRN